MSLYHFHSQIIGRSGGKDATAAAAYRATEKIFDRTTGLVHDYTRKEKTLHSEIIVPDDAPEWCKNRAELWNRVQEKENRKNSQFCREYEVALQSELSLEDNIEILQNFIKYNFKKNGLIADFSIHAPHKNRDGTDNKNLHAHILVTTRKLDKDGWGEKFRAENLEWIKNYQEHTKGGKINGQKAEKMYLENLRKDWADTVNYRFQKLKMSERISEKTLEAQGIDREPQQHQGKAATAMERRGQEPERKKYRNEPEVSESEISTSETKQIDEEIQKLEKLKAQLINEIEKAKKLPERTLDEIEFEKAEKAILMMSPKDWEAFIKYDDKPSYRIDGKGDFAKMKHNAEIQSRQEFIKANIEPITKFFADNYKAKKKSLDDHDRKKPEIYEPKNLLEKTGLYTYTTDNGKKMRYADYAEHQKKLLGDWRDERKPLAENAQNAWREYEHVKNKKFGEVYKDCRKHEKLWQKICDGAKRIYETSPLFAPVRAFVKAVEKHRATKNEELRRWQAARTAKDRTRSNHEISGFGDW